MNKPHTDNYCSGAYKDWMEVFLTPVCNGTCEWCVENTGMRPLRIAGYKELAELINQRPEKNIILLGGEPTLYPDLKELIGECYRKNLYLTTNGSRITADYVHNLEGLTGINISIHHWSKEKNKEITGIKLPPDFLNAINIIKKYWIKIRFNCNIINGYIHDKNTILEYIYFARIYLADSIRFAELKDSDKFVSLAKIFDDYGLNEDPYKYGCSKHAVINGMPVNFRQMCGAFTDTREFHSDPDQHVHDVLYCDGKFYKGWQKMDKETLKQKISEIKRDELRGIISEDESTERIMNMIGSYVQERDIVGGGMCHY